MPSLFKLHLHQILFRSLANGIKQLSALSNEITKWRMTQGDLLDGKDQFSALLEAKDPETGHGFTQPELISEAGLLIVAGTDTTITGIPSTIFYLVNNPSALARLQHEIRNAFSEVEDIRIGPQLEKCRFLTSCINESLRLTPPVGSILPREVLPGGITIDGEWFPPSTDLGVLHYALHHSKDHFPAPFEFQPERWLAENSTQGEGPLPSTGTLQTQGHSAFTAFGVGRASGIGKHLAYQEMSLVLARVVWLYDMRTPPSSVRKLTNTTVRGGRYRWYATNTSVGSVGSAVAMVR
jgi:cytochrome P450